GHTRSKRDWSSDVCSSDLAGRADPTSVLPPDRWREPALEDAPLSPEEHPMSTIDIADRTEVLIARHQEALSAGTHPADLDLLASAVAGNACRSRSRSEEHTSELQSRFDLVCRLLLEKKKEKKTDTLGQQSKQRY